MSVFIFVMASILATASQTTSSQVQYSCMFFPGDFSEELARSKIPPYARDVLVRKVKSKQGFGFCPVNVH